MARRIAIWTAVAVLAALLASADARAKAVKGKREPVYPITEEMGVPADLEIRVLPIKVSTTFLEKRAEKRANAVEEAEIAEWLGTVATRILGDRGFRTSAVEADEADETDATSSRIAVLVDLSDRIVRGRLGPDHSPRLLEPVCGGTLDRGVLFLALEVELATRGYWDAWSGGLKVGMSNSDLRGAILDCASGELLWRGELYIRTVPRTGDERFERAVAGMYDNLSKREGR